MRRLTWAGLIVLGLVGLAGCKSDPCQPSWFGRLLGRSNNVDASMMDCDCMGPGMMGGSMAPPSVDEPILTAPQKVTDPNKKGPEEKFVQPTPFKPVQ